MAKPRDRSASLTQLLAEATNDAPTAEPIVERVTPEVASPEAPQKRSRGGERSASRPAPRTSRQRQAEAPSEGHVRESDGSYTRADGERRVALQLKMHPDDKRALKVQAAEVGLSPAEYVAQLVREDAR